MRTSECPPETALTLERLPKNELSEEGAPQSQLWAGLKGHQYLVISRRISDITFQIAAFTLLLLSLPVNYSGLHTQTFFFFSFSAHTNLNTASTFFLFGLFEDMGVHPKYKMHCQMGWIVNTRLP